MGNISNEEETPDEPSRGDTLTVADDPVAVSQPVNPMSPSPSQARRKSRARPFMSGTIEKITEEPSDEEKKSDDGKSADESDSQLISQTSKPSSSKADEKKTEFTTSLESIPSTLKEDQPERKDAHEDLHISKNPTTENNTDQIDDYYRRNRNNLTFNSQYEKSTEMRRLPDYIRQMRARGNDTTNRSISRISRRSGSSNRSRVGLPQRPADKFSNKFVRSFYFLASKHRIIGFRHMIMLLLVAIYSLIGAAVFHAIESPNEIKTMQETNVALLDAIKIIAQDLKIIAQNTNGTIDEQVKNAYIKLLQIDGKYSGSTFYKLEDGEDNPKLTWTFGSAFFFSVTVFTTIGYGSIAPVTNFGKAITMVYGFICVPLTMVVLRDIGQLVLVTITKLYARLLIKLRTARGYMTTDNEAISLPIKFCSLLSVGYVVAAAVFIYNFDAWHGPPESGMDLFHALYFSFISITTIGLGDVMPNNASFHPLIAVIFFFGLPIFRVVNRVSYVALENGVFGTMALVEHKIDQKMGTAPIPSARPSTAQPPARDDVEARSASADKVSTPEERVAAAAVCTDEYSAYEESDEEEENRTRAEMLNNFTVHSIAAFMRARSDVYGGDFGRVNIRKADL